MTRMPFGRKALLAALATLLTQAGSVAQEAVQPAAHVVVEQLDGPDCAYAPGATSAADIVMARGVGPLLFADDGTAVLLASASTNAPEGWQPARIVGGDAQGAWVAALPDCRWRALRTEAPVVPAGEVDGPALMGVLAERDAAIALAARGQVLAAEPRLAAAAQRLAELLGAEHAGVLDTDRRLAVAQALVGDVGPALSRLATACSRMHRRFGDTPPTVRCHADLIEVHMAADRMREAAALAPSNAKAARDAVGIAPALSMKAQLSVPRLARKRDEGRAALEQLVQRARSELPDSAVTAFAVLLLAGNRIDQPVGEVEPLLMEAIRRYRAALGADTPRALLTESMLSSVYVRAGRRGEAVALAERSYRALVEQLGARSPYVIEAGINLGGAYMTVGRGDRAVEVYRGVEETLRTHYSADDSGRLVALRNIASIEGQRGNHAGARAINEEVLRVSIALWSENHPGTLRSMVNLAGNLRDLGEFDAAEALFRKALGLLEQLHGAHHRETLRARANYAELLVAAGRKEEALRLAEATYTDARSRFTPRDAIVLDTRTAYVEALIELGRTEEAIAALEAHVADVEAIRESAATAQLRQGLLARRLPSYRSLAALYLQRKDAANVFRVSELFKGRALLESIAGRFSAEASVLPADERDRLVRLQTTVAQFEQQAAGAPDSDAKVALASRASAAAAELHNLVDELARRHPRFEALARPRPAAADTVAAEVPAGAVMVSYAFVGDRLAALVARRDSPLALHDLGDRVPIETAAAAYRELSARPGARAWRRADGRYVIALARPENAEPADERALLDLLSQRLLAPLASSLKPHRWIVSPDGELALLPFEVLPFGGAPVVLTRDVSYVQSASVLRLMNQRNRMATSRRLDLLAVGAPDFGPASVQTVSGLRAAPAGSELALRYSALGVAWSPLPGAEEEIRRVAAQFPAAGVRTLRGAQASEAAVRALNDGGELARFRYLLFATHGMLSTEAPELSSIVLTQVGNPPGVDGYLTAAELVTMSFDSDAIVVSACETAGIRSADGVMGLPYALLVAGNRSTVMTLWPVVDASAPAFVSRLFELLRRGRSAGEAVSQAKREFLRGSYRDVRHWAPYIVYGL